MKKILVVLILLVIGLIVLSGCVQTGGTKEYVCSDGRVVNNPKECSIVPKMTLDDIVKILKGSFHVSEILTAKQFFTPDLNNNVLVTWRIKDKKLNDSIITPLCKQYLPTEQQLFCDKEKIRAQIEPNFQQFEDSILSELKVEKLPNDFWYVVLYFGQDEQGGLKTLIFIIDSEKKELLEFKQSKYVGTCIGGDKLLYLTHSLVAGTFTLGLSNGTGREIEIANIITSSDFGQGIDCSYQVYGVPDVNVPAVSDFDIICTTSIPAGIRYQGEINITYMRGGISTYSETLTCDGTSE